jgi:acetylornithine deacetylase/succinyl-diaminopimelate desuccinylase-like protein
MMPGMIQSVLQRLQTNQSERLARLTDYLAIPSVSTDPAYKADVQRAAQFTADQLAACGLAVEIRPTGGHPVVLAKTPDAQPGPRALFYGHYDVQPPDPIDKWTTPPFEPTERQGAIYARGASDDKGQVACFIEALRAWHDAHGQVPANLTVMIEGEEECGSVHLDAFIDEHADELQADVAIVSDTAMWDTPGSGKPGTPAITYALRGLLYFDIKLFGPSRDLHSGVYGNTIANPANELVKVIGRLFDDQHRVTVPGFYDRVVPVTDDERAAWAELPFDETQWAKSVGLDEPFGEAGFNTLERRWCRPSCDVNGLYGGYEGEGAKTVIPSFAGAKVSFRLAADQDPNEIADLFRGWLEARTPAGCHWEITEHGRAFPARVDTNSPYLAAASRAIETGCGAKPLLVREGATIPVIGTFKTKLGIDTLLMGFGLHDDAIHSPNEKFEIECFDMGCRSHAAMIDQLRRFEN